MGIRYIDKQEIAPIQQQEEEASPKIRYISDIKPEPSYISKVGKDILQTLIGVTPVGGYETGKTIAPAIMKALNIGKEKSVMGADVEPLKEIGKAVTEPYMHPIKSIEEGKIASTALAWLPLLGLGKLGIRKLKGFKPKGLSKVITAAKMDIPETKTPLSEIPADLIKQSIETKTPLIDIGGSETHRLAIEAKLNNPKAHDILVKHAGKTLEQQPGKLQDIINNAFGKKTKLQNLDDILEKYQTEAKPMYEQALSKGDLAKINPEFEQIAKNPFIKSYITKARKSAVGMELKKYPDSDIKVLDAAKKKIDDAINVAIRTGEKEEARALQNMKSQLLDKIDESVPEYKDARGLASERFKLEDAQNKAKQIIKMESAESISRIMPTLSGAEKDAFLVGIRDQLMSEISQSAKTGKSNIAEKIFGKIEDYKTRQNLKASLGEADYNKLMDVVNPLVRAGEGASKLLYGSQTAEKLSYAIPHSFKRALRKMIGKTLTKGVVKKYVPISKMLTDPEYLKEMISKSSELKKQVYTELGGKSTISLLSSIGKEK